MKLPRTGIGGLFSFSHSDGEGEGRKIGETPTTRERQPELSKISHPHPSAPLLPRDLSGLMKKVTCPSVLMMTKTIQRPTARNEGVKRTERSIRKMRRTSLLPLFFPLS